MSIVTGDRYLESLVKFVENYAERLIEGTLVLKLNPVGLRYVQSRLEALAEVENLLSGAPVDYLRAYISDLGDHRALEQLRRILRLLPSLKIASVLPPLTRDPTLLCLLPFGSLKVLELRGCNLSLTAAKGMLELRHTLEKLICHNSTDALRHVFTNRIMEIKDSPQWKRLSFVSCACNGLVVMDESLMLLSAVETLDLSRNKLAKVDNLRKCYRLMHLDLGFNNLRSISSLSEVSSQLVNLVLRNNALTTLHGIENLKSLKGLDLSYNVISKFSELEILAGLPSLQNLWLEGNPICFARWFRAHVFSLFTQPDMLNLDEKKISKREFWKRHIIVASRQNQPSSFGYYSLAKYDTGPELGIITKKKRIPRVVDIENEDHTSCTYSDQDSMSSNNDTPGKDENAVMDDHAEIESLMKRIEFMKKEHSVQWLQEFEDWMNHPSENIGDDHKVKGNTSNCKENTCFYGKMNDEDLYCASRYTPNTFYHSEDASCSIVPESDPALADTSTVASFQRYFDRIGESDSKNFMGSHGGECNASKRSTGNYKHHRLTNNEEHKKVNMRGSHINYTVSSTAISGIVGSHSLFASPGSPPQYKHDILHQRHNKEEEFMQLSAHSFSVPSSESNTSPSDDDFMDSDHSKTEADESLLVKNFKENDNEFSTNSGGSETRNNEMPFQNQNGAQFLDYCSAVDVACTKDESPGVSNKSCSSSFTSGGFNDILRNATDWFDKKMHNRRPHNMSTLTEKEDDHVDAESSEMSDKHEIHVFRDRYAGKEIYNASVSDSGGLFRLKVPEMAKSPV